ncbi:MAG: O-antigen ligase family protein [Moorellales bacterium]
MGLLPGLLALRPPRIRGCARLLVFLLLCLAVAIGLSMARSVFVGVPFAYANLWEFVKIGKIVLIVLFVSSMKNSIVARLPKLASVYHVASFIVIAVTVSQYLTWPNGIGARLAEAYAVPEQFNISYLGSRRAPATAVAPNVGAEVALLVLSLTAALAVNGVRRSLSAAVATGLLAVVALTGTRAGIAMVGVLGLMAALESLRMRDRRILVRPAYLVFAVLVVAAGAAAALSGSHPYFAGLVKLVQTADLASDISTASRVTRFWPAVIEAWSHSPILGWGPAKATEWRLITDSEYLYNLLHYGVIGSGIIMLFYLVVFHAAHRVAKVAADPLPRSFAQAVKWAVPAILMGNLTHTLFWDIQSIQAFSLGFSIVLALEADLCYPLTRERCLPRADDTRRTTGHGALPALGGPAP